MIQHMNLVFRADGLNTGEFAFLMACCNHTDDRGYVIATMQQLADEAHMKERTARDNKQRLIKRGLLAAAERYHPKNGARIADLYRVNVDLLKQMQRKPRDYGPTMIEELTFATPEENSRSDPPAESAGGAAESAPTPPAESAPLFLPSSSPSSLSGAAAEQQEAQGSEGEARETATPQNKDHPVLPQQRQEITEMVRSLPGRPVEADARDLEPLVLEALGAGWTLPQLRTHLSRKCDPSRVYDVTAVYRKHLKRLPEPSSTGASGAPRAGCPDCKGTGIIEDPETFLPTGKCACRTALVMA